MAATAAQQSVMLCQPLCSPGRAGVPQSRPLTSRYGARLPVRSSRRAVRVSAGTTVPGPEQPPSSSDVSSTLQISLQSLQRGADVFFRRYDVLSPGIGALLVTGFCVSHGQNPLTALSITFCSTVLALVLNELLFADTDRNRW